MAGSVMQTLYREAEMSGVRERIKENMNTGVSVKDRLKTVKKLTAGQLFKAGSCRVGKTCFEIVKEKHREKLDMQKKIADKNKNKLKKLRDKADKVKESNKTIEQMNVSELTTMLRYYKRKEDGKLPTLKRKMQELLSQWQCQGRSSPVGTPNVSDDEMDVDEDEESDSDDELEGIELFQV